MKLIICKGFKRNFRCISIIQKFLYVILLEIIYLIFLNRWNLFDLEYKGFEKIDYGKIVFQFGCFGGRILDKVYNGINSKKYYQIFLVFFLGKEVSIDVVDIMKNSVGVLD